MMKKYLALAAASLIGLAGVATAADAVAQNSTRQAPEAGQPAKAYRHAPQMHQNGGLPRELQELNLSSKQKADIQKIMEANRPQQAENRVAPDAAKRAEFQQKMQQYRSAEQNLIAAKQFDEAAARRLIGERQAQFEQHAAERKQRMADMEVKRLQERHAVFHILTAKQQKQLLENQEKHRQERERRHAQHGGHGQPDMGGEPRVDAPQSAPQN